MPAFLEPSLKISGHVGRYDHSDGNDDYTQPRNLFRLFDAGQKVRLFANIARHMAPVPQEIRLRQICHFFRADPAYGMGVAQALGIDLGKFIPEGAANREALAGKH
jgi:catalase